MRWTNHVEGSAFARTNSISRPFDFRGANADPRWSAVESLHSQSRLQQQFDDEFPQIPTALLAQLYPQLVAPIPSAAIASFEVSPKQDRSIEGVVVPRETSVFATTASGAECRFRTGFDLPLWPIEVSEVAMPAADMLHCLEKRTDVEAVVRVRLSCMGPTRTFAEFAPRALQFYVDGDRNGRFRLFELL